MEEKKLLRRHTRVITITYYQNICTKIKHGTQTEDLTINTGEQSEKYIPRIGQIGQRIKLDHSVPTQLFPGNINQISQVKYTSYSPPCKRIAKCSIYLPSAGNLWLFTNYNQRQGQLKSDRVSISESIIKVQINELKLTFVKSIVASIQ